MPAACHQGQREFGQRCVPYCKHGYKLAGPSVKYCQSNRRWSSEAPAICVPSKLLGFLQLITLGNKTNFLKGAEEVLTDL